MRSVAGFCIIFAVIFPANLSATEKNWYEVLGISNVATQEEIKSAYRRLVVAHHPDRNPGADPQLFKDIQTANDILSDPTKRRRYDDLLQPSTPPGRWNLFFGKGSNFAGSVGLMKALVEAKRYLPQEEWRDFGLDWLRSNLSIENGQDQIYYNLIGAELADVWSRVGFWVNYNDDDWNISVAAHSAAFDFLADLAQVNSLAKRSASYNLDYGITYLSARIPEAEWVEAQEARKAYLAIVKNAKSVDLEKPRATKSYSCNFLNIHLGKALIQ